MPSVNRKRRGKQRPATLEPPLGTAGPGISEFFRAISEDSSEGVTILDEDLAVVYESASAPRVAGYKAQEWMGKTLGQMAIHPDDLPTLMGQIDSMKGRPGSVVRDLAIRCQDAGGAWRWIEATGRNLLSDPNVRGIVVNYRDITERKLAETALRESEETLSRVFIGSPVGLTITSLADGRFISVNDAFLRIVGYERDEIIGRDAAGAGLVVDAEYRQPMLQGTGRTGGYERIEQRLRTKSGEIRDVLVSADRISIGGGECIIGTYADITERKCREERIARLTRLYGVLSRANDAIVRAIDTSSLYTEICEIVTQEGGFPLAWIGQTDGQRVTPLAWSGSGAGYLIEIRVEMHGELGRGPTGTCIRENRPVVNNDFETNPEVTAWREKAAQYGFRSSGAFPLCRAGRAVAALVLYSDNAMAFDEDQVRLLQSLSCNVSYAMDAMDLQERRVQAEKTLQQAQLRTGIMAETAAELLKTDSPQGAIEGLCQKVMAHLGCDLFINFLADEAARRLRLNAFAGISHEQARGLEWLDYGAAVCGCASFDVCRVVAEGILARTSIATSCGVRAYACHPLIAKDRVLGTLSFGTRTRDRFQEEDLSLVHAVADLVAIAMQRKQAEDEVREARDFLGSLLNNSAVPVIVWDPQLRITKFNQASQRLTGYTEAEVSGRHLGLLFPRQSRSESLSHISRAMAGEIWEATEIPIQRADGSVRTVLWNSAGIHSSEGQEVTATIAQWVDVTEHRRAEEQLRQRTAELQAANRELEAFAYSVSHDLRTPLRSMRGFSEALLGDYAGKLDEKVKDYLRRVEKASLTMGQLIDGILGLSQVARADMRWEKVDLSGLCAEIAQELRSSEPERRVEFVLARGLVALGDTTMLQAVLTNLLENAWKFSFGRDPARIEFGETEVRGSKAYYVRDNGVGFDMKLVDKLFKPFQRLHSKDEFGGTGIGLATVKRIISRHGGRIWAESEAGTGTTFYFTLAETGLAG